MNHKIVKLTVENVMKIRTVSIEPNGNVIYIGGKNANGKTSLISSIAMVLAGKRAIPKDPIRHGEATAEIVAELDDLTVTRQFTPSGTHLTVTSKEGAMFPSPQSMLDKLYSGLTFDPLEFSRMGEKKQVETLMGIVGLDFQVEDTDRAKMYIERTNVNRLIKNLEGSMKFFKFHPGIQDDEVSISKLAQELQEMDRRNKNTSIAEDKKRVIERELSEKEALIKELTDQLEGQMNGLNFLKGELAAQPESFVYEDTKLLMTNIGTAETINEHIRDNKKLDEHKKDLSKLEKESKDLSVKILFLDKSKAIALDEAKFPIEALSFSSDIGGVTYKDIPLSQCSQSEKLRISMSIGMALNPELRILLINDGSLLDEDNMKLISNMADENDVQCWIERVGEGEECSIVLVDGSVKE